MQKYAYSPKSKNHVKVYGSGLRISTKSSTIVCKKITGKTLPKAKALMERVVDKKESFNGKYYTNVSQSVLSLLENAEANTEFRGFDPARMFVHASAHEGFTFFTPRRFKLRRKKRKITHIQLVLEQK